MKNVILAIEQLKERNIGIKFLIARDGDVREYLEKLAKEKCLTDVVIFTGLLPRDRTPEIMSESLVGIANLKELESLEYAMPTKAYEYASCELPVMGSGSKELLAFIKESKGGIFVSTNPHGIADEILFLFENPKIRVKMGKRGRRFVKRHYDRKEIAKSLKSYLEVLVNGAKDN
ncbi:glycosyltransferase [Thermococcus sibiricus]|uniref:glycosyltransferase n=1 Tax=Thermococcus sibiricus TaxID=172049 RepID=UPI00068AC100|nr:glycosyltransferase [Thermococcus sibiricus]